ncbi:DUF7697 family protein [Ruegeria arenilitoris]|uniref:DUF7697 family protein n=1 Tax=Ruegeria arenilitoris TaxID=1173585 RepID=UPI00147EA0C2|nr:hypothetical protein [Ruegeria arenilitoris]
MESQIQFIATSQGTSALGFNQAAALRLAEALGVNTTVVALILPDVEAIACGKINEQMRES